METSRTAIPQLREKIESHIKMDRRDRCKVLPGSTLLGLNPQAGEISQMGNKFLRNEGFEPLISHPRLEDVRKEDESPLYLSLNTSAAYVQENQGAIENSDSALKCTDTSAVPGQRWQF